MKFQQWVRIVQSLRHNVASPAVLHPSRCLTGNWLRGWRAFPGFHRGKLPSSLGGNRNTSIVWSTGRNAALWFHVHTPVQNNLCVRQSFGLLVPTCGFPAALFSSSPAPLLPGAHAPAVHSLAFGRHGPVVVNTDHVRTMQYTGVWSLLLVAFLRRTPYLFNESRLY